MYVCFMQKSRELKTLLLRGAFNNDVDQILRNFDPTPINLTKMETFYKYLSFVT